MRRSVEDAVERIDGILRRTGFVVDAVFGSLVIGLKKISSVFKESGEEQSLGVKLSRFSSDSGAFELVGVLDPELLVIFDKNVMPLLKADLNILLYFVEADDEASLSLAELVDAPSLKDILTRYVR